jgi:hypothetical protein
MSTQNIYLEASRKQLRFPTTKGEVSVEELWGLSLLALNAVYVKVSESLEQSKTPSLLVAAPTGNKEAQLKIDIITDVFNTRKEEESTKKANIERKQELEFLNQLLVNKKVEALQGMSAGDIQQRIAELSA